VIDLGDVFFLRCGLCNPPKSKFFVVVQVQPLRMLLINSDVTAFVQSRPRHLALHVPILQCDHPAFLTHDSFLACDHVSHEHSYEGLSALVARDPGIRKGRIHDSVRPAIATAFKGNHQVPGKYLRDLVPLWEPWLHAGESLGSDQG